MSEYLMLMHDDATGHVDANAWDFYFATLRDHGAFLGGSAIGGGRCYRSSGAASAITGHLGGYIKIAADGFEAAEKFLAGNPVYEAGGTVEIRELPRS